MELYIITCFDTLTFSEEGNPRICGDCEIQFILTDKAKAEEIIANNSCDFQDHAYDYCVLQEVLTDNYLPQYIDCISTYYKFDYADKKWVMIEGLERVEQ